MKQRLRSAKFQEHYNQAQLFYNSLATHEKDHVIKALSFELNKLDEADIIEKMIDRLNHIDNNLASQVALNVGGEIPKVIARENHGKVSKFLSQEAFPSTMTTIKCVSRYTLPRYPLAHMVLLTGQGKLQFLLPMDLTL
jgi:catalase